jgi:hypothetical protein
MTLSTSKQPPTVRTQSFLLRCVCLDKGEGEGETAVWRFTLRDVSAQPQEHRFSTIHELIDFLMAELNKNNLAS